MDVSVIIINYNTISFIVNAIDSIFEKVEGVEYEIIVVDNNSSDNSKVVLAEKYGDKIIYFGLSENIGFGRANNEAAKIAKGRNLFFLNPDTVLLNNAVKILSNFLDDNPDVGCCGGNLYDADEKPAHSFSRFSSPSIFSEINQLFLKLPEKILYGKNIFFNNTNKPLQVAYITGADLMIRKELFASFHGFDPDFFMYHEETELEYRIKKAGYKIISVPHTQIIHLEGKSFQDNLCRVKNMIISRKIFLQKTQGLIAVSIINTLFFMLIISRLLIFNILRNRNKIILWTFIYKQMRQKHFSLIKS